MESQPYTVTDDGERVIAASRRPDGTLRKERRVRAGYVPLDEMPVYQSRGTLAKQNVPKCPGATDDDLSAAAKPKTKAAAKNAKRKEKRLAEQAEAPAAAPAAPAAPAPKSASTTAAEQAVAGVQTLSLNAGGKSATAAAAAPEEPVSLEKQLRALKKKIRQAEGLAAKQAEGATLTDEEQAKLGRLAGWREEVAQLEAQLGNTA